LASILYVLYLLAIILYVLFFWPVHCMFFYFGQYIVCSLSFGQYIVCSFLLASILYVLYLLASILYVLWFTAYGYNFGTFKPSSLPVFSSAQSSVFCIVICRSLFCLNLNIFYSIIWHVNTIQYVIYDKDSETSWAYINPSSVFLSFFGHCIVCSLNHGLWLFLAIVLSVPLITTFDYSWPLYCLFL
jgi:hypothetical protein